MNQDNSGYGCLLLLGLVLVLFLYPVYDGYLSRDLPNSVQSEIKSSIKGRISTSFGHNLYLDISNYSNWVIRDIDILLRIKSKDGNKPPFSCSLSRDNFAGLVQFSIPRHSSDTYGFELPQEAIDYIAANGFDTWSFTIRKISGTRPPLRIVKVPIDFIKGLFERVE